MKKTGEPERQIIRETFRCWRGVQACQDGADAEVPRQAVCPLGRKLTMMSEALKARIERARRSGVKNAVLRVIQEDRENRTALNVGVFSGPKVKQESYAAGTNPDYLREQMLVDSLLGVPTEYTADGDAIFRDRHHRREYLRLNGMYDRDGGYSDPDPDAARRGAEEAREVLASYGITQEGFDPEPDPRRGLRELAAMQAAGRRPKKA